jgi:hypothetical protein
MSADPQGSSSTTRDVRATVVTGGSPVHVAPGPVQLGASSSAITPALQSAFNGSPLRCSSKHTPDRAGESDGLAQQRSTPSGESPFLQQVRLCPGSIVAASASASAGGSILRFRAQASLSDSEWQQQLRQQSAAVLQAQRLNMHGNGVLRSFCPTLAADTPSDIAINPNAESPTATREANCATHRQIRRRLIPRCVANRLVNPPRF